MTDKQRKTKDLTEGVIRGIGTRDIHEETECCCCEDTDCFFNDGGKNGRTIEEKGS